MAGGGGADQETDATIARMHAELATSLHRRGSASFDGRDNDSNTSFEGTEPRNLMASESDIQKYAGVMKEIKLRTQVIQLFLSGKREALYMPTTVETTGLQFRKVFELVAFASLAANRDEYSSAYSDFAKHWEASKLIKNLRRINPKFYPHPVVETPTSDPRALHQLKDRQDDYLTEDELVEAHGRCGVLMHATNPFGPEIQYEYYQKQFNDWLAKIINLLNNHQVHLVGDIGFYLFHMKEEGHEGVRWYRFLPPPA